MRIFIKKYYKYVLLFLLLVIISVFYIISVQKKEESIVEDKLLKSTTSIAKKESAKEINTIYVDVKGAVNNPGVYEVQEGKRVIDAITLAGGLLDVSDTININLSKKLTDEMYIVVYTKDEIYDYVRNKNSKDCPSFECVCPDTKNDACITQNEKTDNNKTGKISINSATKEELMSLPGIGETKANSIIEYRNANTFNSIEDIKNVSGIGESIYEKIKDYISIE